MTNQPGTLKNHGNQPKTMKNHETTLKNHGNQPKTMINHETTLKNHGNQPKTTINHETTLKTMETNQNHEKPWIYLEKTRKPQTGLLGKWSFFVTHTQTLHHNIYIVIIIIIITIQLLYPLSTTGSGSFIVQDCFRRFTKKKFERESKVYSWLAPLTMFNI